MPGMAWQHLRDLETGYCLVYEVAASAGRSGGGHGLGAWYSKLSSAKGHMHEGMHPRQRLVSQGVVEDAQIYRRA